MLSWCGLIPTGKWVKFPVAVLKFRESLWVGCFPIDWKSGIILPLSHVVAFGLQVIKEEKWLDLLLTAAAHVFFLQPGSCRPSWPADSTFMHSQDYSCLNRELQVHRSWKERNRSESINVLFLLFPSEGFVSQWPSERVGGWKEIVAILSFLLEGGEEILFYFIFCFSRDHPSFT